MMQRQTDCPSSVSWHQSTLLLFSQRTHRLPFQSEKLHCIDIDAMENRFPSLCFRFWAASKYIGEPRCHFSLAEKIRYKSDSFCMECRLSSCLPFKAIIRWGLLCLVQATRAW